MIGNYDVFRQGSIAGKATVLKVGMFYKIHCHCMLPDDNAYYLWMVWDDRSERLGICVREENDYGLTASLSTKKIGTGPVRFVIRESELEEKMIFLEDIKDPFTVLTKLPHLRIKSVGSRCGIIIKAEDLQDSGQTP